MPDTNNVFLLKQIHLVEDEETKRNSTGTENYMEVKTAFSKQSNNTDAKPPGRQQTKYIYLVNREQSEVENRSTFLDKIWFHQSKICI